MENIVKNKSYAFALRVVKLYQHMVKEKSEYVLSKQILRSGTSIGANVVESEHAQSKKDFLSKINIALKEANETVYWLDLLFDAGYIDANAHKSLKQDSTELVKLLASIVKTLKEKRN